MKHSLLFHFLVGATLGLVVFIFLAVVVVLSFQGEHASQMQLQSGIGFILFQLPSLPFNFLLQQIGVKMTNPVIISIVPYCLFFGIGNVIRTSFKK